MHQPPRIGGRLGASLEQALTGGCWHSGRFTRDASDRPGGSPVASTVLWALSRRQFPILGISRASSNPPQAQTLQHQLRCFHARAPCRPTVTRYLSRAPLACRATSGGEIRPCFHRRAIGRAVTTRCFPSSHGLTVLGLCSELSVLTGGCTLLFLYRDWHLVIARAMRIFVVRISSSEALPLSRLPATFLEYSHTLVGSRCAGFPGRSVLS